ncbi:hypothetical protein KUM39_25840 [Streptomyces sp. J2-1]|uniref:hypothetical protein n=1 Tax=Streptomyces corallincola TaxID=2851888 RepID=UPI001C381031|nr:hypothetical protein [Streptomyces corallincola]MBV2357737.1 hypothetical protein [Streptomyces corallincola]
MTQRGRGLRFTAVLLMVMLALTGFSRHGHHRSHGSGGGGGCSNSRQDQDSSHSSSSSSSSSSTSSSWSGGGAYTRGPTHRPTDTATATGRSTAGALRDGSARLLSCATATRPASVEISNPNSRTARLRSSVTFYDATGARLATARTATVAVPARGRETLSVPVASDVASRVDHCTVEQRAELVR